MKRLPKIRNAAKTFFPILIEYVGGAQVVIYDPLSLTLGVYFKVLKTNYGGYLK